MEGLDVVAHSFGEMGELLTFISIVFIIICVLLFKFKSTIDKILTKPKTKNRDIKNLVHHSMFLTGDKVLHKIDKIDFTTFECYDEIKTKLLKKLIHLKIDTVKLRFTEFLNKDGLEDVEQNQLKLMVASALSNLVNEYNDKALKIMSEEMDVDVKDARFLIEKYEEFREYIVEAFVDELGVIVMDNNYIDNFERLNTILYTVSISLSIIPRDVVATFNDVNGRFKKYKKIQNE